MSIEDVARENPEAIIKQPVDIYKGEMIFLLFHKMFFF